MRKIKSSLLTGLDAHFIGFCLNSGLLTPNTLNLHGNYLPLPAGVDEPARCREERYDVTHQSSADKVVFHGEREAAKVFGWEPNHYNQDDQSDYG